MPVTQTRKPLGQGEPWNEVIKPTPEGIAHIFEAFGAELPSDQMTDEEKRGLAIKPIPTQLKGIYLGLSHSRDAVFLAFDVDTLAKMIEARTELDKTSTEE